MDDHASCADQEANDIHNTAASLKFERMLAVGRAFYMSRHGAPTWVGASISADEVYGFLRAIRTGLVRVTDDGLSIELVGFSPFGKPKKYQLYGHWQQRTYWSWQEAFIQIAFAAELVLDHGWPNEAIGIESGLDVAATLPGATRPTLLAEAKLDPRDLQYIMQVMTEMAAGPIAHTAADPRSREGNAVNKYLALARYRPEYYVEVAPAVRRVFGLTFEERNGGRPRIAFRPELSVPRPTLQR